MDLFFPNPRLNHKSIQFYENYLLGLNITFIMIENKSLLLVFIRFTLKIVQLDKIDRIQAVGVLIELLRVFDVNKCKALFHILQFWLIEARSRLLPRFLSLHGPELNFLFKH